MATNTSNLTSSITRQHSDMMNRQHSDMQWLMGLQAFGLYQNSKLRQEVIVVQKAIEKQTEFLKESHQETKSIIEKQLEILEAEQNRKQIERNTKQAIFSLKQTIKLIDSTESNFSKYLLAKTTHEIFIESKFNVDSLEDIEDKEYFYNAIELLGNRATDSVKNLSTEHLEIINTIAENYEKNNSLELIKDEYNEISKELELAKVQTSSVVNDRIEGKEINKNFLSVKWGILLIVLGLITVSIFEKGSTWINIAAIITVIGVLIIPYVIFRNIKQKVSRHGKASNVKAAYISSLNDKLSDCIARAKNIIDGINAEKFVESIESLKTNLLETSKNLISPYVVKP